MAADLPTEFDIIVLGTGMPESILAGAFSRIGQRVLHIDKNDYYSAEWAAFNLHGLERLATDSKNVLEHPNIDETSLLNEGERLVPLDLKPLLGSSALNINFHIKDDEKSNLENSTESSVTSLNSFVTDSVLELSSKLSEGAHIDLDNENLTKNEKLEFDNKSLLNENSGISSAISESECTDSMSPESNVLKNNDRFEDADESNVQSENIQSADSVEESKVENCVSKEVWTPLKIKKEWRKFNLDLAPRLLFSTGSMVELLISSDVAKYCEFKTVTRVLTLINSKLTPVPCSRSDVFNSKDISMAEKRVLMKFFATCNKFDDDEFNRDIDADKPFIDFLKLQKLSDKILHYVLHAIAMANPSDTTAVGLTKIKKCLQSLGRYGNTAFLWPMYGSGELPQSFCRLCAVFGGIYCLRMSASALILDNDSCTGIITTEGQRISTKWLIMGANFAPKNYLQDDKNQVVSRAIFITDKSILPTEGEELSLLHLPCPDDENRPVSVIELPASSMTCPQGLFVVHMTRITEAGTPPESNLAVALETLFATDEKDCNKPSILWSAYFSLQDLSDFNKSVRVPKNVFIVSGPGNEIDLDCIVTETQEVFKHILPEEEFLPRPPNPEDIIYVDNEETTCTVEPIAENIDEQSHTDAVNMPFDHDEELDVKQITDNLVCEVDQGGHV